MIVQLALILLLTLSACSTGEPLPEATGPWHALNTAQWQPSTADQQAIARLPH